VIRPEGWEITDAANSPVRFRRTKGMLALPAPVGGGDLGELRQFFNLKGEDDWNLLVVFLLSCLRPGLPFWLLALVGEQGSGKSTCAELLRSLVDPNKVPLRSCPRDERELAIASKNSWLLCLDNVSGLHPWMSDALCRLLSGGGFSTRTLYENDEEELFEGRRPVILNGIAELLGRPDLADRAISITLSEIRESARQTEAKLREEFTAAAPRILGALYSAMAKALAHLPAVRSTAAALPRMADVHLLGLAAERALGWPSGSFERAYQNNRREIIEQTLDADACALAVRTWFDHQEQQPWEGTASELLKALEEFAPDGTKSGSKWPRASWRLRTGGEGALFRPTRYGGTSERKPAFMRQHTLRRHLALALASSALPPLTWYQATRHSYASQMVLAGGSLEKLAKVMGHSSVVITERYAHLRPDLFREEDYQLLDVDLLKPAGEVVSISQGEAKTGTVGYAVVTMVGPEPARTGVSG
jgi:hypothetical protein